MRDGHSATTVRLSDYAPPAFLVDAVALTIDIVDDATTRVTSQLSMRRNPQAPVASSCWHPRLDPERRRCWRWIHRMPLPSRCPTIR